MMITIIDYSSSL